MAEREGIYISQLPESTSLTDNMLFATDNGADNNSVSAAKLAEYVNKKIDVAGQVNNGVSEANSYADTKKTEAVSEANNYTNQKTATFEAIYVSKSGDDNEGTGTSAAPFLTIQKAVDYVQNRFFYSNQRLVIYIDSGIYDEVISISNFNRRITFQAISGASVTVKGFNISSSIMVIINNLVISNTEATTSTNLVYANISKVILMSCTLEGNTTYVAATNSSLAQLFLYKCTINNCYQAVQSIYASYVITDRCLGSGNVTVYRAYTAVIFANGDTITGDTVSSKVSGTIIKNGAFI